MKSDEIFSSGSTLVEDDSGNARLSYQPIAGVHKFHWLIIFLSFVLSLVAWQYSKSMLDKQARTRFDRECDRTLGLLRERMVKYEDALWAGVAMIDANGGDVSFQHWQQYANRIHIEEKYPGVNGVGVVHAMDSASVEAYLVEQRKDRPDFGIHPEHDEDSCYPISYITPVEPNRNAVGLDLAHETNRFQAAKRARDIGKAQITGPITLVQDAEKTPGFLFFAPFYKRTNLQSIDDRQKHFTGLVYAPFVVKKLMLGALARSNRHNGLRLIDGDMVIFDEHVKSEPDYDPDPLFRRVEEMDLYGRTWKFDIWSSLSFRTASHSSEPLLILIGGILIDVLLLALFMSMANSSRKALTYAGEMEVTAEKLKASEELSRAWSAELKKSNADLEQFASIASHDLQEPLRKVTTFCGLLKKDYGNLLDDEGRNYIHYAMDASARMRELIQNLLTYSRIGIEGNPAELSSAISAFEIAVSNLEESIKSSAAIVTCDDLPKVNAVESRFTQVLQNLIGNSIKYRSTDRPLVHVGVAEVNDEWVFCVSDNGIGIAPKYYDRVFGIFKRLHTREKYSGTGIGLAICQRIVEHWNGRIWIETKSEPGCKVCFTIPKIPGVDGDPPSRNRNMELVGT